MAKDFKPTGTLASLKGRKIQTRPDLGYDTPEKARRALASWLINVRASQGASKKAAESHVQLDSNSLIEAYLNGYDPVDILEVAAHIDDYLSE
jgi:hypothetical protein